MRDRRDVPFKSCPQSSKSSRMNYFPDISIILWEQHGTSQKILNWHFLELGIPGRFYPVLFKSETMRGEQKVIKKKWRVVRWMCKRSDDSKKVFLLLQYHVLQASSLVQVWHLATLVPETTINQIQESPTACLVPFMEQQLLLVPDPSQIVQVSQIISAG